MGPSGSCSPTNRASASSRFEDEIIAKEFNGEGKSLDRVLTISTVTKAPTTAIRAVSLPYHGRKGKTSIILQRGALGASRLSKAVKTVEGLGDELKLAPGPSPLLTSPTLTSSIALPKSDAPPTGSRRGSAHHSHCGNSPSQSSPPSNTSDRSTTTTLDQSKRIREDNVGRWSWPLDILQLVSGVILGRKSEEDACDWEANHEENSCEAGHEDSAAVKQLKSLQRLIEEHWPNTNVSSEAGDGPIMAAPTLPAQPAATSTVSVKLEPKYIAFDRCTFATSQQTSSSSRTPLSKTFQALLQDIEKRENPPAVPEATNYIPPRTSATGSSLASSASTARPRSKSPSHPSSTRLLSDAITKKLEDPPFTGVNHETTSRYASGPAYGGLTRVRGRGTVNHCLVNRASNNAYTPPSKPNSIHSHRSSAWSPSTTSRSSFNTSAGSWQSIQRTQFSRNRWSPNFSIVYPYSGSSPSPRQHSDLGQRSVEAHSPVCEHNNPPSHPPLSATPVTSNIQRSRHSKSTSGSPVGSGNPSRTQSSRQPHRRRSGAGPPAKAARQATNVYSRHARSGLATPPVLPVPASQPTSFRESVAPDSDARVTSHPATPESRLVRDKLASAMVHKKLAAYAGLGHGTREESRGTGSSDWLSNPEAAPSHENDPPSSTSIGGKPNICDRFTAGLSLGHEDEDGWTGEELLLSGVRQGSVGRPSPLQIRPAAMTRVKASIQLPALAEAALPLRWAVNERWANLRAESTSGLGNNPIREEEEGNEW